MKVVKRFVKVELTFRHEESSNGTLPTLPSAACASDCTAHTPPHWVRFGVEAATPQTAHLCDAAQTTELASEESMPFKRMDFVQPTRF